MKITHTLNLQLKELIKDEPNFITNLSNASALLFNHLTDVNWAGFYLWDDNDNQLVLGPFQGQVACTRIENGSGVCGSAFQSEKTHRVANVHEFPGHIACDSASNSEIVIPLYVGGNLVGVLDIDSPEFGRFTEEDQVILEEFVSVLNNYLTL